MPIREVFSPISPSEDTWISEHSPTTSNSAGTALSIGLVSGKSTDDRRALLQFSLSAYLTSNSVELITKAELVLTQFSGTGDLYVRKVTQDFDPNTATWNTYNGTDSWATPGGDYEDEDSHFFTLVAGENRIEITDLVLEAIKSGSDTLYLIVMADSGPTSSGLSVRSLDYGTAGERPAIEIEYATRGRRLQRSSSGG